MPGLEFNHLPEVIQTIRYQEPKMARRAVDTAKRVAVFEVPVLTGHLRSTIQVEHVGNSEFNLVAQTTYAKFVEYGTRKMSAQPYMTPAAHAMEADVSRNTKLFGMAVEKAALTGTVQR